MPATLYAAGDRLKTHEMNYSTSADFALSDARPVSSSILLDEPGWSPYCIDHATHELICVRLPAGIDLAVSPFYFVTQYHRAEQLLKLPLADLSTLTASLADPLVSIIYSTGRCGTTLASHALNASPQAWSLSEPEVFNHRSLILPADSPISGGDLLRAIMRLIYAQRAKPDAEALALKLRSQSLFHMQSFVDGRPDARAVFMYRDAFGWAHSVYQFLGEFDWPLVVPPDEWLQRWDFFSGGGPLTQLARYIDLDTPSISLAAMIGAGWLVHLDTYLERLDQGALLLALRYNELDTDRAGQLERLYRHVGLGSEGLDRAMTAFDEDSQKGTSIARREGKRRLTADQLAEIAAVLARHPRLSDPNLILPDIYSS